MFGSNVFKQLFESRGFRFIVGFDAEQHAALRDAAVNSRSELLIHRAR